MGHSLTSCLGDGPADSSVLQLFRRVLETLSAIHATGASHLPLSPSTIRLNDSNQPQIQSSNRLHEDAATVAFGSVKYSAPEAFADTSESSSCESVDCYVLGFMFYEILIGKRSFVAQFAPLENGSPSLWLKWHADRTAKARPLIELRPNLGHFARLIDGMMEKDPSKRVNRIAQVLNIFSNVEAQTAHSDSFGRRTVAPKALNRGLQLRNKVASTLGRFVRRLAALRKTRVAGLGALLAIATGMSGLAM